jgi:hypothetical protein
MGTVTLTLRIDEALVAWLDKEAKRRSVLAGAPGAISRNVVARILFEQARDGTAPAAKPEPKAPKPGKVATKPKKGKRSALPKAKASTEVSAEERALQKRVAAIPGGYRALAKHLKRSPQYVHKWSRGKTTRPWTDDLAAIRQWLDSRPAE